MDDRPSAPGWATRSLEFTLHRALVRTLAIWQLPMLWAIAHTPGPAGPRWALAAAHVALIALAELTVARRFPSGLLVVAIYALVLADWAADSDIDGVLTFAACWLANFTACIMMAVLPRRLAAVMLPCAAVTVPLVLHAMHPAWGTQFPLAVFVTTVAIGVALWFGKPLLFTVARRADEEAASAAYEAHRVAVLRTWMAEVSEDARLLHDTVVNTLGAIARGGASVVDRDAVRARCSSDAAVITELKQRRNLDASQSLTAAVSDPRLRVLRTGIEDDQVRALTESWPPGVAVALLRAAREAVQNAEKHADVDEVVVDARVVEDRLVVSIADQGVGFTGHIPDARGLAESVFGRAAGAGLTAAVDTAPGQGTTVVLSGPLHAAAPDPPGGDESVGFDHVVGQMFVRASWLWSMGVTAVGLTIEVVNRPGQFTAVYPMLAVMTLTTAIAWRVRRPEGFAAPFVALLSLSSAAIFVLSAAAVDFARTDAVYWQAMAPTGVLGLVVATRPSRRVIAALACAFAATVMTLTAIVWPTDATAAAIIPVAGAVTLVMGAAWLGFQAGLVRLGARAAADQRAALRSRVESADRVAAVAAGERWRAAGLGHARLLLEDIGAGRLDPADPATRSACDEEERYLRQLLRLNPELVHLGRWLVEAQNRARSRGVDLRLNAGAVDARDAGSARAAGDVLLWAVDTMPTGAVLHASVFASGGVPRLTLVARHPHLAAAESSSGSALPVQFRPLGDQDLVEVSLGPAAAASADRTPA